MEIKFGTDGVRGVIGETYTKEVVQKISQAVSNLILKNNEKKLVVIGYDKRFMSNYFAEWCGEVLIANGIKAIMSNCAVTTPNTICQMKYIDCSYAFEITASHNPYRFNGIKVFYNKTAITTQHAKKIEEEIKNINQVKSCLIEENKKLISYQDFDKNYIQSILKLVDIKNIKKSNIKVAFDVMHGAGLNVIKKLVNKLDLEDVIILNPNDDAFFEFGSPNPLKENVQQLIKLVKQQKFDMGFAIDGDGDRITVIDNSGNVIDNNYVFASIYYYLNKYKHKKGDVVKNINTLDIINVLADKFGNKCYDVNVGFKYVVPQMKKVNALMGGENNGGMASREHIYYKDSLFCIAYILDMITTINMPYAKIIKEMKKFADNYDFKMCERFFDYNIEDRDRIINCIYIKKQIPNKLNKSIKNIDYNFDEPSDKFMKVYFVDGTWLTVRFSGNEPVLRIVVNQKETEESDNYFTPWLDMLGIKTK